MDKQTKKSTYKTVIAHFLVKNLINPKSPMSQDILKMMIQRATLNMKPDERADFLKKLENNPSEVIDIVNKNITPEDKTIISHLIKTKFSKALLNTFNSHSK